MPSKTRWLLLTLPTIVVGLVLIVFLNWHVPTLVRIGLKVNRMAFTVGGENTVQLVEALGLKSIVIQEFATVKLTPAKLTPATESSKPSSSARGETTAKRANAPQPISITPSDTRALSNVTLSVPSDNKSAVFLIDSIDAAPRSDIILETTEDGDLIVHIQNQQPSGKITASGPLILAVDQSKISGVSNAVSGNEQVTWNLELAKDSSLEFIGQQKALTLALTAPADSISKLFPEGRIPLTAIKFERLNEANGTPLSSLVRGSECEITYPDYKSIDKVTVNSPDFLSLDSLEKFSIEEITYDANNKSLALTMQGEAGKIVSGSSDYSKDHRLTLYDSIWNNHMVIALFVALCWVAGATAALYKLMTES